MSSRDAERIRDWWCNPDMWNTFAVACLVAVSASLVAPAQADAKVCLRVSAPAAATTSSPVVVEVTTVMLIWSGARVTGWRPERLPTTRRMLLALETPSGAWRTVRLYRVHARPSVWRAAPRLRDRGTWRLSVLGWDYAPRTCAPTKLVRVR